MTISPYSSPEQVASELDFDDTSFDERRRVRRFLWKLAAVLALNIALWALLFALPGCAGFSGHLGVSDPKTAPAARAAESRPCPCRQCELDAFGRWADEKIPALSKWLGVSPPGWTVETEPPPLHVTIDDGHTYLSWRRGYYSRDTKCITVCARSPLCADVTLDDMKHVALHELIHHVQAARGVESPEDHNEEFDRVLKTLGVWP